MFQKSSSSSLMAQSFSWLPWSFPRFSNAARLVFSCLIFTIILESECKEGFLGDPGALTDFSVDFSAFDGPLKLDESEVAHRRAKRFLSFPPSSTASLETVLTVPLFDKYDSYVVGTFKGYTTVSYNLPSNFVTIGKSATSGRASNSVWGVSSVAQGRLTAYGAIESAFDSLGMDGRQCLQQAVCQAAQDGLPLSYGLLGEVVLMLLSPTHNIDNSTQGPLSQYTAAEYTGRHGGECSQQYTGCPVQLRDLIQHAVAVLHSDSRRGKWH